MSVAVVHSVTGMPNKFLAHIWAYLGVSQSRNERMPQSVKRELPEPATFIRLRFSERNIDARFIHQLRKLGRESVCAARPKAAQRWEERCIRIVVVARCFLGQIRHNIAMQTKH